MCNQEQRKDSKEVHETQKKENSPNNDTDKHRFWNTRPIVGCMDTPQGAEGPIADVQPSEVRKIEYNLPVELCWDTIDIRDDSQAEDVLHLLDNHYVQDESAQFRLCYSIEFLRYAILVPGYNENWFVGVRATESRKLLACIAGIISPISISGKSVRTVEINFLCSHEKLRKKRLAPLLIKEVTRRVQLTGINQAIYTCGKVITKPLAAPTYYHRLINTKKLVDYGFLEVDKASRTINNLIKKNSLPSKTSLKGLRPATKKDIPEMYKMLSDHLRKFALTREFSEGFTEHYFLPRDDVIVTYVVDMETPVDNRSPELGTESRNSLSAMISFYISKTLVLDREGAFVKTAYSFYNFTRDTTNLSMTQLMYEALILAKMNSCDVFNCLDVMDNLEFMESLGFAIGSGHLHYYLYNWKCDEFKSSEIGYVIF